MPPSAGACHTTDAAEKPDCGRAGPRSSIITAIGWRRASAALTGRPSSGPGTSAGPGVGVGLGLALGDGIALPLGEGATIADGDGDPAAVAVAGVLDWLWLGRPAVADAAKSRYTTNPM